MSLPPVGFSGCYDNCARYLKPEICEILCSLEVNVCVEKCREILGEGKEWLCRRICYSRHEELLPHSFHERIKDLLGGPV